MNAGTITELRDLVNELNSVTQWYLLGIYLGVQISTLEEIKKDYTTAKECRTQTLVEWQKHVTPTWAAVVKALVEIERERLASTLAEKYGMLDSLGNKRYLFLSNSIVSAGVPLPGTVDSRPLENLELNSKAKQIMVRIKVHVKYVSINISILMWNLFKADMKRDNYHREYQGSICLLAFVIRRLC